jgi:hypothetical protein
MEVSAGRVASVRGMVFFPQMAARSAESFFGAKMPNPLAFMAKARFRPGADYV